MSEEKTQRQIIQEWLDIFLEREKKLFRKYKVSNARDLLINSFMGKINGSEVVENVSIKFLIYLRYLDIGVGNGVPVGSRAAKMDFFKYRNSKGQLHHYGRKAKPLYNKPFTHQFKKLLELLVEDFGSRGIQVLEQINDSGEVKIQIG